MRARDLVRLAGKNLRADPRGALLNGAATCLVVSAEREIEPGDYVPACAEACPTRAIVFGDLDDPHAEVARMVRSPRAFRLLEDLGTEPKVYYLREGEA